MEGRRGLREVRRGSHGVAEEEAEAESPGRGAMPAAAGLPRGCQCGGMADARRNGPVKLKLSRHCELRLASSGSRIRGVTVGTGGADSMGWGGSGLGFWGAGDIAVD